MTIRPMNPQSILWPELPADVMVVEPEPKRRRIITAAEVPMVPVGPVVAAFFARMVTERGSK